MRDGLGRLFDNRLQLFALQRSFAAFASIQIPASSDTDCTRFRARSGTVARRAFAFQIADVWRSESVVPSA